MFLKNISAEAKENKKQKINEEVFIFDLKPLLIIKNIRGKKRIEVKIWKESVVFQILWKFEMSVLIQFWDFISMIFTKPKSINASQTTKSKV